MTDIVRVLTPEEAELDRKLAELRELEGVLAERELQLEDTRSSVEAFRQRYLRSVGSRLAELDRINLQIAEVVASQSHHDRDAAEEFRRAQQRAEESARATSGVDASSPERTEAAPELRTLYRDVARRVHPDLATDDADRLNRTRLMALANEAYARRDAEALVRILAEAGAAPESVAGDDVAAQLIRAIRSIARVRDRLARIAVELEEARSTDTYALMDQAGKAREQGRDLLAEMGAAADRDIGAARERLVILSSPAAGETH
jgi:hypothetical protein